MTNTIESTEKKTIDIQPKLHLWPALVFVFIGLGVSQSIAQFGSTNNHNLVGFLIAPLSCCFLILLWWLFASRVSWRDRLLGTALFGAIVATLYVGQQTNPHFLIALALPYLVYGVVILFALVRGRSWWVQRRLAVVYLVLCAAVFSTLRVDSYGGDLSPEISWRWEPSVVELPLDGMDAASPGGVAVLPAELGLNDWPAFRGAKRDSHLLGVQFSRDWTSPPRELWRNQMGKGWSSLAAVGDYLFTQEQRGDLEVVVCYAAKTGEEVWVNSVKAHFEEVTGPGPRATPTYLEGKLYVQGATGILQCIDAPTGAMIWQRDLTVDTGAAVPDWGFSSSPLIVGDILIQFSGGREDSSVVAYHRATGELAWNTGKGGKGYSSAHFVRLSDIPQVLVTSNFGIQSFIPETGDVLWEHHWQVITNPRVAQPIVTEDGGILIGTASMMGTRRLSIAYDENAWKVSERWTTKKFRPYFNDYILYEGYCYGFDGNRLTCINAETGQRQWRGDRIGGQLLFVRDMEMLLILTEKGDVMLVEAKPEGYTVVSQFKAISRKTWNHPVIAHGKLFVRNAEEMACFELSQTD